MSIKKNSKMEGGDSSHQIPNHNPQRLHTYTKLANDTRNKLKSMCVYGTEKPKSKKIQFSHSVSGVAVGGMLAEKSGSQARSKKEKPKTADDKNCSHQEKQKVESVKSKKTVQKRKQVIGNCTGAKDVTQKCTKEICFQAGNLEKQKLSNNQPLANADNTKQRVQCFARTQLSAKNTTLSESDDSEDSILPKISRRSRIKDTKTFCNDIKQMPQMAKKHGSKPSQHLDHNVKPSPDKIENPSAESSKDVSKMSNKRQKQLNSFANLTVTDISEEMILEDDSDDDEDDNDDDEDDDDDVSLESLCDSSVDHDTESNKAANFSVTVYVLDGDANIECPNPTDFLCSTDIIVSKDCSIEEFDQMMEKLIAEKFPTYTGGYEYDCPYKHVLRSILKGSKFILEEKVEKEDINLGFILQLMGSMYVVLNEPLNPAKIKWASLSSTSESSIISSSTCTPAFSSSSSSSSSSSASHFSKPVIKSKKKHSTAKSSMTSQDCFSGFQLNLDGNPMEGLMLSQEVRSSLYNPVDFSRKRKHIEPKVDFGLQEYGTPMTVNGSETYLTLENVVETMMAKINDLRSLWLGPSPKQSSGN